MTPFSACQKIPHSRLRNQIKCFRATSFVKDVLGSHSPGSPAAEPQWFPETGFQLKTQNFWMRDSHCESTLLFQIIGRPVVVKLNSGVDYRGVNTETIIMKNSNYRPSAINQHIHKVLACLDGYMNIALEQTEEYVNGQVSLPMDRQCWIIIRLLTSSERSSLQHSTSVIFYKHWLLVFSVH